MQLFHRAALAALFCTLPVTFGCRGATGSPAKSPEVQPGAKALAIETEDFPRVAHQTLLSTARSVEEKLRLAGVAQHQLERAERLFVAGHDAAGEDAAVGAMLLLREDDAIAAAVSGQSPALLRAAHAAARRGDSGRAAAFYTWVAELTDDEAVRKDAQGHLLALERFIEATQGKGALMQAGSRVRHALARATVDPARDAYQAAEDATVSWMEAALDSAALTRNPESLADREEALEAYRAIRTGAPALIALSLRQADPMRAVARLGDAKLGRALPGGAKGLIVQAGKKNDPEAWLQLFQLMDGARRNEDVESNLPSYLSDAGALWAAISLYRSSPGELKHAMPLSMMLLEFGMPEVATTLLAQNVGTSTSPEALAWSMSLVMRAMLELGETEQIDAARLAFREAESLLRFAEAKLPAEAESSRALHLMLANLEIRLGNTERALPLLRDAATESASAATWLRLAEVEYQTSGPEKALAALGQATRAARLRGDVLTEARALEVRFTIERDRRGLDEAREALALGLRRALTARDMDLPQIPAASVERVLARILENYGDRGATRRAFDRALEASRKSSGELTFTLTEMARSALSTGDVRLARKATESAFDLAIDSEDQIYIALWQQLLERRTGRKQDQLPSVVLRSASDATGWAGALRSFGLGELGAADLKAAAAGDKIHETEALFYTALAEREEAARRAGLEQVAASSAIDLVEVRIARDLLAAPVELVWPEDVEIP